ncbi:MAG TPA: zinc ribbon domain-containing protein [Tepidisphaeraceae bacterium]|nr:zinc ribbon domain-containing protein [Tepidisphaeraceae bacterium]
MPMLDDDDGDEIDDEEDAREYPDDDEADWNLDPSTHKCPYCGEEISEDAQQCPYCDQYLSKEDAPPDRKPLWIKIGVVFLVLIIIAWTLNWY